MNELVINVYESKTQCKKPKYNIKSHFNDDLVFKKKKKNVI